MQRRHQRDNFTETLQRLCHLHVHTHTSKERPLFCGTPKNTIQTPRGVLLKDHILF